MRVPAGLFSWLSTVHSAASVHELSDFGLSESTRRFLIREGILAEPIHGVFRVAGAPVTHESRCRLACAASQDVVIAGRAGGRLWNVRRMGLNSPIEVLAFPGSHPVGSPYLVTRTCDLPQSEIVRRNDGIRVLAPHRLAFDLARVLDDDSYESALEQIFDQFCQPPTVWEVGRRLARSGRNGSARFRRVMESRPDYHKPKDSDLEVRVLRAMRRRGIELQPQVAVRLPSGVVRHLDGGDQTRRWGVEIDHVTWHGGRGDAQRDKALDRQYRRLNWTVERVGDHELTTSFNQVIDELVASYQGIRLMSAA